MVKNQRASQLCGHAVARCVKRRRPTSCCRDSAPNTEQTSLARDGHCTEAKEPVSRTIAYQNHDVDMATCIIIAALPSLNYNIEDRAMPQKPIVTLTLNPALDVSTSVDEVIAGPKLRCVSPRFDPGGGGINASRVIARLGGQSVALVALAGASGVHLQQLLEAEGIDVHTIEAPGATRESLTVTEDATGKQFRFVMPGPTWTDTFIAAAIDALRLIVPKGAILVFSGSQPPGIPSDFVLNLTKALKGNAAVFVDTSGATLKEIAKADEANLRLLRMDGLEADELAGHHLTSKEDTAAFAASLVARGVAQTVIIARGAEGSVLASKHGQWLCKAPDVPVKSKIGAGDSFMGAYVLASAQGLAEDRAFARGVAAASAAVMTEATELCKAADAIALISRCLVTPIKL